MKFSSMLVGQSLTTAKIESLGSRRIFFCRFQILAVRKDRGRYLGTYVPNLESDVVARDLAEPSQSQHQGKAGRRSGCRGRGQGGRWEVPDPGARYVPVHTVTAKSKASRWFPRVTPTTVGLVDWATGLGWPPIQLLLESARALRTWFNFSIPTVRLLSLPCAISPPRPSASGSRSSIPFLFPVSRAFSSPAPRRLSRAASLSSDPI